MKVSVVITTCKREPSTLKVAIDSVLAQTYKDSEIIIVNDAPEYEQRPAIEKLIQRYDNKVKYYVNERQQGANYSRNFGAKESQGEILSFLDDDDYWDPSRLEKMMNRFQNGSDILYSDFYIVSEHSKKYSKREYPEKHDQLKKMLAFNYLGGFSNVTFRKSTFEASGRLDEKMKSYQDQDLFVRLIQKGKVDYIPEPLSYYRIMQNSISLNNRKKLVGLQSFIEKYDYLFQKNPGSLVHRLESELVYSVKQGWDENAKVIMRMLSEYESNQKIQMLYYKGKIKYFAVKYFKMQ